MTRSINNKPFVIGVTGGQGVGKSTFCRRLQSAIQSRSKHASILLDGLGQSIRDIGVTVGSAATDESIAAVYIAHLRRQRLANADILILDRCAVDALAYVRCLALTGPMLTQLYEEVTGYMISQIDQVVHLEMTGVFEQTQADHETPKLRRCIAEMIPLIIKEYKVASFCFNASCDDTTERFINSVVHQTALEI